MHFEFPDRGSIGIEYAQTLCRRMVQLSHKWSRTASQVFFHRFSSVKKNAVYICNLREKMQKWAFGLRQMGGSRCRMPFWLVIYVPWGHLDARKRVIYVCRALWCAQKRVFYEGLFARLVLFVAQVRCFCLAAKAYFSSSGRGVFHAFLRVARFRGESLCIFTCAPRLG